MASGTSELLLMEKNLPAGIGMGVMPMEVDLLIPFPGSGQDTVSVIDMTL